MSISKTLELFEKFITQTPKNQIIELFDKVDDKFQSKPKLTCNTCEHRQRWQCNSVIVQYCGVRKSKRTDNGLLKIKCKTESCPLYKEIDSEKNKVNKYL